MGLGILIILIVVLAIALELICKDWARTFQEKRLLNAQTFEEAIRILGFDKPSFAVLDHLLDLARSPDEFQKIYGIVAVCYNFEWNRNVELFERWDNSSREWLRRARNPSDIYLLWSISRDAVSEEIEDRLQVLVTAEIAAIAAKQ